MGTGKRRLSFSTVDFFDCKSEDSIWLNYGRGGFKRRPTL